SLEGLLDPKKDSASNLAPGLEILSARSQRMAPLVAKLKSMEAGKGLTTSISSLASSYLHMHANRLLRSAARAQELVIYDFLARTYESQQARARKPVAET